MADEQVEVPETPAEPDLVEEAAVKEASSQGWVPKDKFKGDEKDWVDAQMFVKRGREILPILRKNNENLLKELNATKESMRQFKADAEEFKKFQRESYERKAKDLEREMTELRSVRAQAITDGDGAKVNAIDDAIDVVKDEVKAAKIAATEVKDVKAEDPPTAMDPNLQAWLDRNEWFGKDKAMTGMTNSLGETLRIENPGLMGVAFLKRLDEALAEQFPSRFGKETKRTPNFSAESGSGRGKNSGAPKKSYENLPADARAACDKFVKQKLMTKEDYVSSYDWSE